MSLWHGSNTTFLLWGFYIGILIIIEDRLKLKLGGIGIIRTNILVMLGLIIFFSSNVGIALSTIHLFFSFKGNFSHNLLMELTLNVFALIILIGLSFIDHKSLARILKSKLYWPLVYLLSLFSFVLGTSNRSFIYFDF
jgi:D-alanyl-lipoteichoic acid acyltransferase DltB (MBOAT superfamily)